MGKGHDHLTLLLTLDRGVVVFLVLLLYNELDDLNHSKDTLGYKKPT